MYLMMNHRFAVRLKSVGDFTINNSYRDGPFLLAVINSIYDGFTDLQIRVPKLLVSANYSREYLNDIVSKLYNEVRFVFMTITG